MPVGAEPTWAVGHFALAMQRDDYSSSIKEARRQAERATDPYLKEAWAKLANQYEQLIRRPGSQEPSYRTSELKSWKQPAG
jgi:hypothetical protein